MSKAVAVFSGTVISIADLGAFTGLHSRNATLDMLDSWKGATETPITVATGYGSADCGYPFEIGNQYLVYAYEYQGALATNICWRTAELSQASADLAYLQTQPTETATPARPSVPVLWLGAAACGLLVLAAPAVVAWRRRAASPAH